VLYQLADEMGDERLREKINETYLINKFAPEEERLKLRPTENNDKALRFLLRGHSNEEYQGFSKLIENYNYFKKWIVEENFEVVLKGLSNLIFVEISLERDKDYPQRIFESLNSTGLELTQADLIRNYILMGLKRRDQNKIYENYWEIIEKLAKDESSNKSRVSDFIRDYLTLIGKKIPTKSKVYLEFKKRFPTTTLQDLENNLTEIKTLVKHYNKLVNPKNETDRDIQRQLKYINKLEINVAYPFLLKIYDDFSREIIDREVFIKVLDLVQSFTWRRFIVGLPTNALNKIFMNLYDKVEKENYLYSIERSLMQKTGVQRFPRNSEVVEALQIKDVYNVNSKNRTYLLERLENFENNEPVIIENNPGITIEHVFPQNPDPKWKIELGAEEYDNIKENYLNTIGNLTLSGNNGKLGNKPFTIKRDLEKAGYKASRLWLNKYLASLEKWDRVEIENRFDIISKRFLEIWKMPVIREDEIIKSEEVNIFEADSPKGKKLEYALFFDQKLKISQVAKLYREVIGQLFDLQPETFFTTELAERLTLTKEPTDGEPRAPMAINETYYIEGNIDNIGKFDRIKLALTTFGFEDELMIKYRDKITVNKK